jgi:hypothetical protein
MHADATFEVTEFTPSDYVSPVTTGAPVGHAHMVKQFAGELEGRSTTQFSYAYDAATEVGTYVAMEAFEAHSAGGQERSPSRTRRPPTAGAPSDCPSCS